MSCLYHSLLTTKMKSLEELLAIARSVGWGASYLLRSYYYGKVSNQDLQTKQDEPVTAADIAVSHYILERLQDNLGTQEFGYISEETYKSQADGQLNQSWVWIIDPLDGTRDFIDKTGEYAIHIALVKDGRPVLAVVAAPEAEKLYYATLGGGTFGETRDGKVMPLKVSEQDKIEDLIVLVSRSHRSDTLNQLLQKLPCQNQQNIGSIGCKIAAIVEQRADIYISLSSKSAPKDWDLAAPELILTEAGGKFTHFDGTSLIYNQEDVSQWGGLLGSNGKCHAVLSVEVERIIAQINAAS